jgi:hypothetical protein
VFNGLFANISEQQGQYQGKKIKKYGMELTLKKGIFVSPNIKYRQVGRIHTSN